MQNKYIFIAILAFTFIGFGVANGAPSYIFQKGIMPEASNTYDLGTTTSYWRSLNVGSLTATSTTATSTFAGGISLQNTDKELFFARRNTTPFDFVWYRRSAGTWTDITTEAAISLGTVSGDVLDASGDTFVIGKASKFTSVYIDVGTAVSSGGSYAWEYSTGGDTWAAIPGVVDGTTNLTTDGVVSFSDPGDWVTDSQNGSAQYYFIRLRVTGGSFTTEPTVYLVVPTDGQPMTEIYANTGDTTPTLSITRNGNIFMGLAPTTASTQRLYVNGAGTVNGALTISGSLSGVSSITNSSSITETRTSGFGLTSADGLAMVSSAAATAAAPVNYSPRLRLTSNVWEPIAAASKSVNWKNEVIPFVGDPATSKYTWEYGYNAITDTGFKQIMSLESEGNLNVLGASFGAENLTNGALTSGTSWTAADGFSLTSNYASYTHSASGGTLTQAQASLATALKANTWYRLTYTTSSIVAGVLFYLDTDVAHKKIYLQGSTVAGTFDVVFKTNSSPTDFIIHAESTAGSGRIDTLSLQEKTGGNIVATGNVAADYYTAASTTATSTFAGPTYGLRGSDLLASTTERDRYGDYNLLNFNASLGKLKNGAIGNVDIAYIGDSWVASSNINTSSVLYEYFNSNFGFAGVGYVPLDGYSGYLPFNGSTRTTTGTWTDTVTTGIGLNLTHTNSTDTATPANKSLTCNGTNFTLYYLLQPGGGSFQYSTNWGASTTVATANASNALGTVSITQARGIHTINMTVTNAGSSGVTLMGIDCEAAGAHGIKLHKLGMSGSDTGDWASVSAPLFQSEMAALNPELAIIQLGTNDIPVNTVDTYISNIRTIIGNIKAASSTIDILLVSPAVSGRTGPAGTITAYAHALQDLARQNGYGFVDNSKILPSYFSSASTTINVWTADAYHLNSDGAKTFSENILRYLGFSNTKKYDQSGRVDTLLGDVSLGGSIPLAPYSIIGTNNVRVGVGAGQNITSGSNNIAIGGNSLLTLTTGNFNSMLGTFSGQGLTTGSNNFGLGYASLLSVTTGSRNVGIGINSGRSITTGSDNIFIGDGSGYDAVNQLATAVNSMAIGRNTYTTASNQVVLGNDSITQTLLKGNVGIGTTNPVGNLWVTEAAGTAATLPALGSGTGATLGILSDNAQYGLIGGALGTGDSYLQVQRVSGSATAYNMLLQPNGGNVGIGTTSPYAKLSVAGTGVFDNIFATSTTATSTFAGGLSVAGSSGLTVLQNGNVGIGTTSPNTFKLQVLGNIGPDRDGTYNLGSAANRFLYAYSQNFSNGANTVQLIGGNALVNGNTGYVDLQTGAASKVRITNGGLVGIGTTTPASTLDIAQKGDGTRSYLQIDSEAGAPPAGDCDSLSETGRMIVDHTNHLLYVCNQHGGRGWDTATLND